MGVPTLDIGERLVLTLWVGAMWTVGYIVAPLLFASLEDRALAGSLAGELFRIVALLGLFSASVLLVINQLKFSRHRANWRAMLLLVMLVLTAAGHFVLTPMIAELRAAGNADSTTFARLHGVSAMLYLINSLLGLALVIGWRSHDDGA